MDSDDILSGILLVSVILFLSLTFIFSGNPEAEGKEVYVANEANGTITVIDTETQDAIDTVNLWASEPHKVNHDPQERYFYVTNHMIQEPDPENQTNITQPDHALRVIDKQQRTVTETVDIDDKAGYPVATKDGSKVYLSVKGSREILEIETEEFTIERTFTVDGMPNGIALNEEEQILLSPNTWNSRISEIDLETGEITHFELDNCESPSAISLGPENNYGFVTCQDSHNVHKIDLTTLESTDKIQMNEGEGTGPTQLAKHPAESYIYVTNNRTDAVHKINLDSFEEETRIQTGQGTNSIAFTPEGNYAYVTNTEENTVSVIETMTDSKIETIEVGKDPLGIAIENGQNHGW